MLFFFTSAFVFSTLPFFCSEMPGEEAEKKRARETTADESFSAVSPDALPDESSRPQRGARIQHPSDSRGARIQNPSDLHATLRLPKPTFADALEPIPVSAETFSSSLLPAFATGVLAYRVQVGAIRLHKNVAFFEVNVLADEGPVEVSD